MLRRCRGCFSRQGTRPALQEVAKFRSVTMPSTTSRVRLTSYRSCSDRDCAGTPSMPESTWRGVCTSWNTRLIKLSLPAVATAVNRRSVSSTASLTMRSLSLRMKQRVWRKLPSSLKFALLSTTRYLTSPALVRKRIGALRTVLPADRSLNTTPSLTSSPGHRNSVMGCPMYSLAQYPRFFNWVSFAHKTCPVPDSQCRAMGAFWKKSRNSSVVTLNLWLSRVFTSATVWFSRASRKCPHSTYSTGLELSSVSSRPMDQFMLRSTGNCVSPAKVKVLIAYSLAPVPPAHTASASTTSCFPAFPTMSTRKFTLVRTTSDWKHTLLRRMRPSWSITHTGSGRQPIIPIGHSKGSELATELSRVLERSCPFFLRGEFSLGAPGGGCIMMG
mmetsp:Transcript_25341/g.54766  ORF Transcript_25341/g.54766 Transcript_25341/m.54766 type:complete len:387 (-) Transcript_25341:71-1231(-)